MPWRNDAQLYDQFSARFGATTPIRKRRANGSTPCAACFAIEGHERARQLIERLVDEAQAAGAHVSLGFTTPYVNTIPVDRQPPMPGDRDLEARLRHYVRWNALAMVVRANKVSSELGGHVASFASAATLYDVGFNHFFRAPSETFGGDLVFFQGHSSPGVYARAFLEGRITEEQLENFRQEVGGKGLSSYPHPWLMPGFWQFPTVSMGLGPIMSIYQARFMRYLHDRNLLDTTGRKVWAFVGDGEMDEPESQGAISLAGREKLDDLIWVVNANLQRLDGPVRGNGKIIQELEGVFKGAGWNVIKVIWGSRWDPLLAADKSGRLVQLMNECVDGDYQTFKSRNGRYVRDEFFGRYPETKSLVEGWTDDEVWNLQRGGHDSIKVYAAYKAAVEHRGQPTVVLAKTIKGYGMGEAGEAQNIAHQAKKMEIEAMRVFRDRFALPISDAELSGEKVPFLKPSDDAPEMRYLRERLAALGSVPQRRKRSASLTVPQLSAFEPQLQGTGDRHISTTMAFVRILNTIARDGEIGPRVVPIVADESRTFGMEGMFRQLGIYSSVGQLYHPQDAEQLMWYREDKLGQILQEGINEAGALSSWIAAGTSYSNHNLPMIPFYIFYSMFGFQRVGDLTWAAGDSRTRGFLLGATSGRTTLNGEGLTARGRQQSGRSFVRPQLRELRPNLRLRAGGHHSRRRAADARRAGRRLLLHHAAERKLSASGDAARCARRHPARHVPPASFDRLRTAPVDKQSHACSSSDRAQFCAKSRLPPICSQTNGRSIPTSGALRASTSCSATASRHAAGTCCIPANRRAFRTSSNVCRTDAVPASPRPTTSVRLPSKFAPSSPRQARHKLANTSLWEPTATDEATSGESCARSSKSIGTSLRSQR